MTSNKNTNPLSTSRHLVFGRQPGIGVRTQFIQKTLISCLPWWLLPRSGFLQSLPPVRTWLWAQLVLTWWEGSFIMLDWAAAAALGGSWCHCRKHPSSYIDKCCRQELRSLAKAAALSLMLLCLKFYQVLKTAGTHKASLKSFLSKSKSAFLEVYRDMVIYPDRLACILIFLFISTA